MVKHIFLATYDEDATDEDATEKEATGQDTTDEDATYEDATSGLVWSDPWMFYKALEVI